MTLCNMKRFIMVVWVGVSLGFLANWFYPQTSEAGGLRHFWLRCKQILNGLPLSPKLREDQLPQELREIYLYNLDGSNISRKRTPPFRAVPANAHPDVVRADPLYWYHPYSCYHAFFADLAPKVQEQIWGSRRIPPYRQLTNETTREVIQSDPNYWYHPINIYYPYFDYVDPSFRNEVPGYAEYGQGREESIWGKDHVHDGPRSDDQNGDAGDGQSGGDFDSGGDSGGFADF